MAQQSASDRKSTFTVAVLIACHNRKAKTLRCLDSLFQARPKNWVFNIYLVDDGSTDGTSEAVRNFNRDIIIIEGTGNWYWAHSMYQAEIAINKPYDAILWINDDVDLFKDSLSQINSFRIKFPDSILVGQLKESLENKISYGGYLKYDRHPFHFNRVFAENNLETIDSFNGNLVFIPKVISEIVGHIDGGFAHAYADIDFGLRARRIGIENRVIPGFIGICESNLDPEYKSLTAELKALLDTKSNPLRSQVRFLKRHGGIFWWVFIFIPFLRIFLKNMILSLKSLLRK